AQTGDVLNDRNLSAMIYAFGQFLDHDLDLTTNAGPAQPFNVAVPAGDPYFDPNNTGTQVITLNRSKSDPATGTTTPRQQINELTAPQTLFVREHNRWADRIAHDNPGLSDEDIYQRARTIVGAELQVITYKEWLPAIFGRNPLAPYRGYDHTVNPGIANEFST